MDNSLTPREIQTRIRAGASIEDLVSETGMSADRLEAFAGPVLAEREHVALSAQKATIRRRGEAGTHRRLGELIAARLRSRSIDADDVQWDAWRQPDLKWRVIARLASDVEAEAREAEFVFDAKGRFSVADNADARWMIGEEPRDAAPEDENTVDFHDELALVRATQQPEESHPGDEVPASELMHESNEDTSELDSLYDMLSGISEDSVRIYTGILDEAEDDEQAPASAEPEGFEEIEVVEELEIVEVEMTDETPEAQAAPEKDAADEEDTTVLEDRAEPEPEPVEAEEPVQEPLVEAAEEPVKPPRKRRRAKVPSWDEIMFGGPTK
ncbi:septation protein SepH [Tessaracoccus massiliensis]|uniref:septation protein SepH n=1 Tax=Tessaracoccus massiliensis TaxID=1522311 RepID=UPI0005917FFF|nr:septation protein SepH [Tessaracoccus massiliensis]